jgi:hypothetical protein
MSSINAPIKFVNASPTLILAAAAALISDIGVFSPIDIASP